MGNQGDVEIAASVGLVSHHDCQCGHDFAEHSIEGPCRGCRGCDSVNPSSDHDHAYERCLCGDFQSLAALDFNWLDDRVM